MRWMLLAAEIKTRLSNINVDENSAQPRYRRTMTCSPPASKRNRWELWDRNGIEVDTEHRKTHHGSSSVTSIPLF